MMVSSVRPSPYTLIGNRLYFNELESQKDFFKKVAIAVERLPLFAQENVKERGLSFLRYIHWRAITLRNSLGKEELILVNIRSAIKRLALLGCTGYEVMDLLNGPFFIEGIQAKILEFATKLILPRAGVHFQYQIPALIDAKILKKEDAYSFVAYLKEEGKDTYLYRSRLKEVVSLFYYDRALQKISREDRSFLEGCEEEINALKEKSCGFCSYEELFSHFLAAEKQTLIYCPKEMMGRLKAIKALRRCSYQRAYEQIKEEREKFESLSKSLELSLEQFQSGIDYAFQWNLPERFFFEIQNQFRQQRWAVLFEYYIKEIPHLVQSGDLPLEELKDFLLFAANQQHPPLRFAQKCVEMFYEQKMGFSSSSKIIRNYQWTFGSNLATAYKVLSLLKKKERFVYFNEELNEKKLLDWIERIQKLKNKQQRKKWGSTKALYFDTKEPSCMFEPRALQMQKDGKFYLHFSKISRGDQRLGKEAGFKSIKTSVDLQTGEIKVKQSIIIAVQKQDRGMKQADIDQEIAINTFLHSHEDIATIIPETVTYSYSKTASRDKVRWIMPFYNGGDLLDTIEGRTPPLSLQEKYFVAEHLLAALDFIHREKKIIHRDVKPSNIFLRKNPEDIKIGKSVEDIKIGLSDWGLACRMDDIKERKCVACTPDYASPELARAILSNSSEELLGAYHFPVDLWAAGLTLYQLFRSSTDEWKPLDQALFWMRQNVESFKILCCHIATIQEGWLPFAHENSIRGLICALLHPNPRQRLDSVGALKKMMEIRGL